MKLTLESTAIESADLPSGTRLYAATRPVKEYAPIEVYEPPKERWLAPKGASTRPGSGTQIDPYRVGTSTEYDAIFRRGLSEVTANPTTFHLDQGDYYTCGPWAFPDQSYMTIGSGESLIGAGSRRTTIYFDHDNATYETGGSPRIDAGLLWAGVYYGRGIGMRVENLCLDGQYRKLKPGKLINSGVRFFGSHFTCRDVGVKGLKGSYELNYECFPISSINYDGEDNGEMTDGGATVQDCWTCDMAPSSYVSAFSLGYRPLKRRIIPSVIERCHVDSGSGNYFAFSFGHQVIIRNCSCCGVRQALYNDTNSVNQVIVENSHFEVEYGGLTLISSDAQSGKSFVKVRRCTFIFHPLVNTVPSCLALISRAGEPTYSNIDISDCTFISDSPNKLSMASIAVRNISAIRVTNNVFSTLLTVTGIIHRHYPAPTPPNIVTFEDNRNLKGEPLVNLYQL